jgi:hypothetical protein
VRGGRGLVQFADVHHARMLKPFVVGLLGTVAVLMLGFAVWIAAVRPIDRPGLVWGGSVYRSKEEFKLYLRSKGLSYRVWLARNPGVAPWEPGRRARKVVTHDQGWDWKRDILLAVNAALLATIAAVLLSRPSPRRRPTPIESGSPEDSTVVTAAKAGAHSLRYVRHGASELLHEASDRANAHPETQWRITFYALGAVLALTVALLLSFAMPH